MYGGLTRLDAQSGIELRNGVESIKFNAMAGAEHDPAGVIANCLIQYSAESIPIFRDRAVGLHTNHPRLGAGSEDSRTDRCLHWILNLAAGERRGPTSA